MSKRRSNSGIKWLLLAVLVSIAMYVSRGYWKPKKTEYSAKSFYEVKRGDMLISVTEDGALRALNETLIRSGLEGFNRIISLVPEGSHVQKGDLLVELDSSGLRDRLNEQELLYQDRMFQLTVAKENLKIHKSLTESQVKDGELRIQNAQDELEKYKDGEAPLQIKTVESRSGILREQVRIARDRSTRTEELFKMGSATRSELEADALSLKREELALTQYQEDLRLIKKYDQPNQIRQLESNLIQAQEDLVRLKHRTANELAQAEGDLKTSQRSIELMEEGIELLKRRLENTKIFAPQEGLVVYAQVSPFQNMSGGGGGMMEGGRGRGGRGGGPGGDGGGMGGGGGRRGNRMSSAGGGSGGAASGAQSVAAANQRIASAITGASAAESGGSGAAGGGASSARSGGSGGSGGGGGSAGASFASYSSMRPSSSIPPRSSSIANSASPNIAGSSGSSGVSSGGGSQISGFGGNQSGRSRGSMNSGFDFDMPVTMGVLEEGIMVRQRQELIRLPDVSKMLAQINVNEGRVRQVKAGMTAYIQVENIPDRRFKGTVKRVALLPDPQASWMNPDVKVFPTDIMVDDELPDLKPGVSARTEIIITNLSKVLSVPIQTVARLDGENVCYVKRANGIAIVPVTTGWYNDIFVEIKSGLKEGDKVLLAADGDEDFEQTTTPGETNAVEAAVMEEAAAPAATEDASRGGRRGGRGGRRGQNAAEQE